MTRPRLAVTLGDPGGVGPEVVLKALLSSESPSVEPVVIGPRWARERAAAATGSSWPPDDVVQYVEPVVEGSVEPSPTGQASAVGGQWAMAALESAAKFAEAGDLQGIVTAPVSKAAVNAAGHTDFVGHTEYFGERVGVPDPTMFFWGPDFCVSLVTVHCPLAAVPTLITPEQVRQTIARTADVLFALGVAPPRIGVCGLNPHAGEQGLLGSEDEAAIAPGIASARGSGVAIEGPLPGDTAFMRAARGEFDAIVAMYHDQGLAPFKLLAFDTGVNVTLGLPYVRTSVDHGTAFDIAGTGKADPTSMISALRLAVNLTNARTTAR